MLYEAIEEDKEKENPQEEVKPDVDDEIKEEDKIS
jgi:hypothetical protein